MKKTAVAFLAAVLLTGGTNLIAADDDYVDRMSREHSADAPVASPATKPAPAGEISEEEVEYATLEGSKVRGYLASPKGKAGGPALIVIHEWWGLNDNIRAMARRLAGEGYQVLAVDLYEGKVTEDRGEASILMKAALASAPRLEENLTQAYGYLEKKRSAAKIGVIGWCFGGAFSLQTALLFPGEIDAAVIYYGRLILAPPLLETLQMPILGIFGERDQGIPVAQVRQFEETLLSLGKDATIKVYEGAEHAFANPSGTRYKEDAAKDAWERTTVFLRTHLQ